jgi:hypothetical protein
MRLLTKFAMAAIVTAGTLSAAVSLSNYRTTAPHIIAAQHAVDQGKASRWQLIGAAIAQTPQNIINGVMNGHWSIACNPNARPTVSGATLAAGSCDHRGRITAPTTAGPVITFGTAYAVAPWCDVTRTDGESSTRQAWTVSTTAITFTTVTIGAGTAMNWQCYGVQQ